MAKLMATSCPGIPEKCGREEGESGQRRERGDSGEDGEMGVSEEAVWSR